MIWLLLSILLNTYIGIVFKVFHRFGISNLQGIVANYFICVITGSIFLGHSPFIAQYLHKDYVPFAILQGLFFFVVFYLISKSTMALGVSATQVSNKLSLVIPVVMAYFLFGDSISFFKIIGVLMAGIAVYLASQKADEQNVVHAKNTLILPILIFLGSGFLDTLTTYIQHQYFHAPEDSSVYIIFCFASGAFFSSIYLLWQLSKQEEKWSYTSIAGGIVLGIPNFFSIYAFIKALGANVLQTSALVPVNNIAVVFASAVCAILFFHEKLNKKNYLGLAFALFAIVLIIFGDK